MKGDFTKAKSISPKTKKAVWERQRGKSILSGKPITISECCCHYIARSASGVGYEWNIIGLTFEEHRALDTYKGINIGSSVVLPNSVAKNVIKTHLMSNYDGWSEEKCKYIKYFEEKDYEVNRKYKGQSYNIQL